MKYNFLPFVILYRDVKTKGLKLKVHKDVFSKLIEIAKKDKRTKEIISKSRYFEELVYKDLRLLIIALNEEFLDFEGAKEMFLEMLDANGVSKEDILKRLNISEKTFSVYLKLFLKRLAEIFGNNIPKIDESIKLLECKDLVIKKFLSTFISIFIGNLNLEIYDKPPSPLFGDREEVKEFFR